MFEESGIASNNFTWEGNLSSSNSMGTEKWTFTITDESGMDSEVSFNVTTQAPYIPAFSPTYLVISPSGVEMLDFYLTCTTDDWEMVKIVVTYPGGLGSEVYVGNGQIITAGTPFTFPNYFPKLGGNWTFSILGYIKSGVHVNESFTTTVSIVVTVK